MKRMLLISAAAAAMLLTACQRHTDPVPAPNPDTDDTDIAYLSIHVESQMRSKAGGSGENDGSTTESALQKLYIVTFDALDKAVVVPGSGGKCYAMIDVSSLSTNQAKEPEAVRISASAKNIVVVANPGASLERAIDGLADIHTFADFNAELLNVTTTEIMGTDGFAMITGGDETGKTVDDRIPYPYVAIGDKIKVIAGTEASAATVAKNAAEADRLNVSLERLAAKLVVKERAAGAQPLEVGAKFVFLSWTVDAVNGCYYPFAEKTLIAVTHTPGIKPGYQFNFYTRDPNYTHGTGLAYGGVNAVAPNWSYVPVLPWTNATYPDGYYGWKTLDQTAYVIENTMAAAEQKFGNATRIVMKATYTPKDFTQGADWFQWAGKNYRSLSDLKSAYTAADASSALQKACDAFYNKIKEYYDRKGQTLTAGTVGFATLQESDITAARVPDGGEVVKHGVEPVIRWYQGGVCYYYYEIRHDNSDNAGNMAYAKYGVVRNNWYNLTLNTVKHVGTPWYPDINKPGPGDPDPKDPIDKQEGYLGVSVEIEPWIIWETDMNI